MLRWEQTRLSDMGCVSAWPKRRVELSCLRIIGPSMRQTQQRGLISGKKRMEASAQTTQNCGSPKSANKSMLSSRKAGKLLYSLPDMSANPNVISLRGLRQNIRHPVSRRLFSSIHMRTQMAIMRAAMRQTYCSVFALTLSVTRHLRVIHGALKPRTKLSWKMASVKFAISLLALSGRFAMPSRAVASMQRTDVRR